MSQLQRVKERLIKYKEQIDDAEERELTARTDLIEAESRVEKTLSEVEGLKRRLVLLREDLAKTQERLATNQEKLEHAEGKNGNDDEMRQEFEATELERDEQLMILEEECLNAKKLSNEAHTAMVESERKMVVLEKDLQRTEERLGINLDRVEDLEKHITSVGGEIRGLEERDNDAAEREQLSEEKTKFLEDQLREVVERAEMAEREGGKLERLAGENRNEIGMWKEKAQELKDEVQKIEDMADEQLEEHETRPSRPAEREEREREPEPEPEPEPEEEPEAEADVEPEPASDEESGGED